MILYLTLAVLQMDLAILANTNLDKGFFPPEFPSYPQAIATIIVSSLGCPLCGRKQGEPCSTLPTPTRIPRLAQHCPFIQGITTGENNSCTDASLQVHQADEGSDWDEA